MERRRVMQKFVSLDPNKKHELHRIENELRDGWRVANVTKHDENYLFMLERSTHNDSPESDLTLQNMLSIIKSVKKTKVLQNT